jgi:glucose/arabinose dehydrogenase
LPDKELKITRVNMLRVLVGKADNMQKQKDNVSTEIEILRKNQKQMLKTKNMVAEMSLMG